MFDVSAMTRKWPCEGRGRSKVVYLEAGTTSILVGFYWFEDQHDFFFRMFNKYFTFREFTDIPFIISQNRLIGIQEVVIIHGPHKITRKRVLGLSSGEVTIELHMDLLSTIKEIR